MCKHAFAGHDGSLHTMQSGQRGEAFMVQETCSVVNKTTPSSNNCLKSTAGFAGVFQCRRLRATPFLPAFTGVNVLYTYARASGMDRF